LVVVIFDWDGTIVNTMPLSLEMLQDLAFKSFNVEPNLTKEIYYRNIGGSREEIWRQIITSSKTTLLIDDVNKAAKKKDREWYEAFLKKANSCPVFDDVPAALSKMKKHGYNLCVSSGGFQEAIISHAKTIKMDHYFTIILGSKKGFEKGRHHFDYISEKLKTKPKDMAFVGDGPHDMRVGKEYGCLTIGRMDLLDEKTLLAAGADLVLKDFSLLPEIIKERIEI